jgi:hypothetical protein
VSARIPRVRWIAAVILFAAGCGDSTNPPAPAECSSVADPNLPSTISYQGDIVPLLTSKYDCTAIGCHGSSLPGSAFSFASHASLFVAGPQAAEKGMCSVRPGAPEESYLVWKIEGRQGILGDRMPDNATSMTAEDIATIRQWILEGAKDN